MDNSGAVEIFVFQKGKFLGSRCFTQSAITIGSSPDCALRLRHATIDNTHALVRVEGGSVMVADNQSAGGVMVNGQQVSTQELKSHDEVTIGPFRLKVTLLGAEEDDPGFGVETTGDRPAIRSGGPQPITNGDDDVATIVRRTQPPDSSSEEATVPRIELGTRKREPKEAQRDGMLARNLLNESLDSRESDLIDEFDDNPTARRDAIKRSRRDDRGRDDRGRDDRGRDDRGRNDRGRDDRRRREGREAREAHDDDLLSGYPQEAFAPTEQLETAGSDSQSIEIARAPSRQDSVMTPPIPLMTSAVS
jgi:pSer/pThr/pTyr-binding forkhead associated (FHA) protein